MGPDGGFFGGSPHAARRNPQAPVGRIIETEFRPAALFLSRNAGRHLPVDHDLQPLEGPQGAPPGLDAKDLALAERQCLAGAPAVHRKADHGSVGHEGAALAQPFHPCGVGERAVQLDVDPLMPHRLLGRDAVGSCSGGQAETAVQQVVPELQGLRQPGVGQDVGGVDPAEDHVDGELELGGAQVGPVHQPSLPVGFPHGVQHQGVGPAGLAVAGEPLAGGSQVGIAVNGGLGNGQSAGGDGLHQLLEVE